MTNHFHCILRSRHDVVATWSDDEVALKWWVLCPARKNKDGSPAEPTEFELNSIRNDTLEPKRQAVRAKKTVRRASNKGCLSMGLGDYLQLLDWTGRQIRSAKRGGDAEEPRTAV